MYNWVFNLKGGEVSIHPMCRFKRVGGSIYRPTLFVSIHPMCRFKKIALFKKFVISSFNTSYVSVQGGRGIKSIICLKSFNTSYVSVQDELCFDIYQDTGGFNTSYVSVQVSISILSLL